MSKQAAWRWRLLSQSDQIQIIRSMPGRVFPFFITCTNCLHECAYYRRTKRYYTRSHCPRCDHPGVVL